ncbi:uncharacterized protein LOC135050269 isoform X3 [Pseudophryne corroboree]
MQNINNKYDVMCTSDDDLPSYQTTHVITNTENFDSVEDSPFGLDFSIIPDFTNILELAPAYSTKMDDATADGILRDILNKPEYCHNAAIQTSNVVDERPFFPTRQGVGLKHLNIKQMML